MKIKLITLSLFILIIEFSVNGQTPTPNATPDVKATPQISPTLPQITDPKVKAFVERTGQIIPMSNEAQKLMNMATAESNPKAEAKFLEALKLTKELLQELENKELSANISQTGQSKIDHQLLLEFRESGTLGNLGYFYKVTHQPQQSLFYSTSQLKLIREMLADDKITLNKLFGQIENTLRFSEVYSLFFIGSVLSSDLDKPQEGLEYINQAISGSQKLQKGKGDYALKATELEASILILAANAYRQLSNRQKSIESLLKALQITQTLPNKEKEIAFLYFAVGNEYHSDFDFANALHYLSKGLEIAEKTNDKTIETNLVSLIALVYENTHNQAKANEYWERGLNILLSPEYDAAIQKRVLQYADNSLRQYAARNAEIEKLLSIANSYRRLKQYDKALEYYNKVLPITRLTNNLNDISTVLSLIGNLYLEKEDWENGEKFYRQVTELSQNFSDKGEYASQLSNLAYGELNNKKLKEALQDAEKSLLVFQSIYHPDNLQRGYASVLSILARIQNELGNRKLAIFYGKQAVNAIQRERQQLKSLDQTSQRGYLQENIKPYRRLISWLIAENRVAEAEQVLQMLKEEELSDYLRRDDKVARELLAKIPPDSTEKEALQRFDAIADEITKIGSVVAELENERKIFLETSPDKEFPKQAELDCLENDLIASRTTFTKFLDELSSKFSNRQTGEKGKTIEEISATQALLKDLHQPNTVIISTVVEDQHLNLIVTTSKVNHAHTIEIPAEKLNELAVEFRQALQDTKVDPRPLGKQLYDLLFPPAVQRDLAGVKADTIIWSLDGILRYIPMPALWDGKQYLVEKYNSGIITLAGRQNLKDSTTERKKLTALGLGVSKEVVISDLDGTPKIFPALTAVPQELCSIVNDPTKTAVCSSFNEGKPGVITGRTFSDDQFTFRNFSGNLGRYPIVHIASHFALNPGNEGTSYLLLGGENQTERKLTLVELKNKIADKLVGTELLTLSACNTGMSAGAKASGEEVESFAAVAQQLGAKSVLSSLWAVADPSTRDLMTEFYRQLQSNPQIGKAEVLRNAQLALLQGKYKTGETPAWRGTQIVGTPTANLPPFKTDVNAPFAHPYYWSPFILIGNWR